MYEFNCTVDDGQRVYRACFDGSAVRAPFDNEGTAIWAVVFSVERPPAVGMPFVRALTNNGTYAALQGGGRVVVTPLPRVAVTPLP